MSEFVGDKSMTKIGFIEAVRGLAALSVVLCHMLYGYYEGIYFGKGIDEYPYVLKIFSATPLIFIVDGAFAVNIFFVLSGFALSYSFFLSREINSVRSSAFRRYFRLTIPISISVFLGYLLKVSGLLFNGPLSSLVQSKWMANSFNFKASLIMAINEAFFDALFAFDVHHTYNPILWTMTTELYGSFFVYSILSIVGLHARRYVAYFAVGIILLRIGNYAMVEFLNGIAICDLYLYMAKTRPTWSVPSVLSVAVLLIACFIGGQRVVVVQDLPMLYMIASSMLVLIVTFSALFRKAMDIPILQFLGKISFSLYLTHFLIIYSFTYWISTFLLSKMEFSKDQVFATVSLPTIAVCIIFANYYAKFVDQPSIIASRRIYEYLFGNWRTYPQHEGIDWDLKQRPNIATTKTLSKKELGR